MPTSPVASEFDEEDRQDSPVCDVSLLLGFSISARDKDTSLPVIYSLRPQATLDGGRAEI